MSYRVYHTDHRGKRGANIVGEVRNEGSLPLKDIWVSADLYWNNSLLVAGSRLEVFIDYLNPGEKSPIFKYEEILAGSMVTDIAWHLDYHTTTTPPYRPAFHLEDARLEDDIAKGLIVFEGPCNADSINVVCSFYDSSGDIRDVNTTYGVFHNGGALAGA